MERVDDADGGGNTSKRCPAVYKEQVIGLRIKGLLANQIKIRR